MSEVHGLIGFEVGRFGGDLSSPQPVDESMEEDSERRKPTRIARAQVEVAEQLLRPAGAAQNDQRAFTLPEKNLIVPAARNAERFADKKALPIEIVDQRVRLGEEALERLPERGDHERSTFPELAGEGKLGAYRHDGIWLTVNTPKDLRAAEEYVAANPAVLGAV